MPEVKTESGEIKHFKYTIAGKKAAEDMKKKVAKAKKKKPASKKKAYRTGGLEVSKTATANPAYSRWLERKAKVRNHFPNTADGNRRLLQAIGPMPSKTSPKKKYKKGGLTAPTKQATRRAKYKKQAKSLLKKQRTS